MADRIGSGDLILRPWSPGDERHMVALIEDDASDPLWVEQFHSLHGPCEPLPRWKQTIIATNGSGLVVGAATIAASALHGTRFPCAIEVVPSERRRGVGTKLLNAVRGARPYPRNLSSKARSLDAAAIGFVRHAGGRVYQRCSRVVVNPRDAGVQQWVTSMPYAREATTSMDHLDRSLIADAFAKCYRWVHQSWSPVTDSSELTDASMAEAAALDPVVSTATWDGSRLAAAVFAFPVDRGFEVVAETVVEDELEGARLLSLALARVFRIASRRGALLEFDGHVTDPHLQPVLAALPHHASDELALVEIP